MLFSEVLSSIQFKVGTLDDITGKAVNPIINNRQIVRELNTQLNQYANITKGIHDVFSFPLTSNTPIVVAPPLALRSEAYYYMFVISLGTIFPMDMRNQRDTFQIFRYNPTLGITNWILPWNEGNKSYLAFFPMNSTARLTTTLNGKISKTATTITVVSSSAFVNNNGRLSIGDEKILYGRKDSTNFYDCVRGAESTIATSHANNLTVYENNIWLFYSRRHWKIVVTDDTFVDPSLLNREMDIVEEHLEGIIKAVAYNLLIKIDPERAVIYKIDSEDLFAQYKSDMKKGYYRGRMGTGVRMPYPGSEDGIPYGPHLMGY